MHQLEERADGGEGQEVVDVIAVEGQIPAGANGNAARGSGS